MSIPPRIAARPCCTPPPSAAFLCIALTAFEDLRPRVVGNAESNSSASREGSQACHRVTGQYKGAWAADEGSEELRAAIWVGNKCLRASRIWFGQMYEEDIS